LLQPIINIQDFLGIRGCRRDLSQQGIGIKRDWRKQLVQLLWRGKRRLRPEQRQKFLRRYQRDY
jgi:hypothetical protein